MKKYLALILMALCINTIFAQKEFYDDIVYPAGGAKGTATVN